jgi:hypothetical protein
MRNLQRGADGATRNEGSVARLTARDAVVLASLVVCVVAASGTVAAAGDESLTVFLNLPMTNGFSDATHALVEVKELVRGPLSVDPELRLVDRAEDADVVLTVLGRGKGHVELTTALRNVSRSIVAPPVPIAATERYIEVLLTTGSCRTLALTVEDDSSDSCFRRVFVGVGLGEPGERRSAGKRRPNSWEACAEDAVRDVRAWLTSNATRLRALRANPSR